MSKDMFKNWQKVFKFTFKNIVLKKTYLSFTLILTLVLFLLPAVIMPIVEGFDSEDDFQTEYPCSANEILLVKTDAFQGDFEERYLLEIAFNDNRFPDMSNLKYTVVSSLETAMEMGKDNDKSLILYVTKSDTAVECNILFPEGSSLTSEDGENYNEFLSNYSPFLFIPQTDLSISQLAVLLLPTVERDVNTTEENNAMVKEVLGIAIPYIILMFMYFMVLFYGQNISGNVLLEKTSKLIDTMLLSIRPEAIILGKVLSGSAAAILQFVCWMGGLTAGLATGCYLVKLINPDTAMALVTFFDSLNGIDGMFSVYGMIMALLVVILGFLMYCALAAISGALASKQEDLSSTQSIFALVLVFGFFIVMKDTFSATGEAAVWTMYLPITSVMTLPAQLMLSNASPITGIISILILIITCIMLIICAGKIYKALVFHKGNIPKFKDVINIILK